MKPTKDGYICRIQVRVENPESIQILHIFNINVLKMGLFNNLFGSNNSSEKKEAKSLPWIPLVTMEQLADIVKKSFEKPQAIFKHSTTCGISRMALNQFTSQYNIPEGQLDLYFLDLKGYRQVSNEVANIFNIGHESPQLLIVKNGSVVVHASHGGIMALDLQTEI